MCQSSHERMPFSDNLPVCVEGALPLSSTFFPLFETRDEGLSKITPRLPELVPSLLKLVPSLCKLVPS